MPSRLSRLLRGKVSRKKKKFNAYFRAARQKGFEKPYSIESALLATEPASSPLLRGRLRQSGMRRVQREEISYSKPFVKARQQIAKVKYKLRAKTQKLVSREVKKMRRALEKNK